MSALLLFLALAQGAAHEREAAFYAVDFLTPPEGELSLIHI